MPRQRDDTVYEETQATIKTLARQQMAEDGTAAISLRGIGRAMDMTAPALYRYYPTRDDLITALIVDGFNGLADALEAADAALDTRPLSERLLGVLATYRQWAIDHRVDFQLIYGNPIPGYVAPREITVPAVIRTFVPVVRLMEMALQSGALVPNPPYDTIPSVIEQHEQALIAEGSYPISPLAYHLTMVGWTQIHGIIVLEMYEHLGPNVGDVDQFYETTVRALLTTMGMRW
ncbi:MAG: TetR/AcrR family transcriptional regulator [Anaerolineae bacterium]|nr:TetR/AcrR family transcriptional regulator [Anaerolineae bacterium]